MAKILVVDDEQSIREMLQIYLVREGHDVTCEKNGETALIRCKKTSFDVVVADIKMPRMDGITLLNRVKEMAPDTIFIMITAFASFETAKEAEQEAAYDYITKPFDIDVVKRKIDAALKARKEETVVLRGNEKSNSIYTALLGNTNKMKKVFDLIARTASSKSNVLVFGESGTGKELVARAIHYNSPRRENPFVTINCGGIPETLLESELFGYKKGAFTGAAKDKKGFVEVADGGTLFLDEVGELPISLQVKLLRVVQERIFTSVGGTDEVKVDIRIISATNRNLEKRIIEGAFREDLYYRLNVINIFIPPLRERKEDIPILANHFLSKFAGEFNKDVSEISSYAMEYLMNYHFPGNVRELENIIESGVSLSKTSIMLPDSFELSQFKTQGTLSSEDEKDVRDITLPLEGVSIDEILEAYEQEYVEKALEMSGGSIKGAAELLNVSFRSMRYRLKKLNIDAGIFK